MESFIEQLAGLQVRSGQHSIRPRRHAAKSIASSCRTYTLPTTLSAVLCSIPLVAACMVPTWQTPTHKSRSQGLSKPKHPINESKENGWLLKRTMVEKNGESTSRILLGRSFSRQRHRHRLLRRGRRRQRPSKNPSRGVGPMKSSEHLAPAVVRP